MKGIIHCWALAGMAFLLGAAGQAAADKQKVYRNIASDHLEGILKDLDISFKKSTGKTDSIVYLDFEKGKTRFRLHNYNGNDLWIDVVYPGTSLEQVNRWNRKTLSSRAVLFTGDKQTSTYLECQLDCQGGVTDGMIRRFIQRFEIDAAAFAKFLGKQEDK
ncbi:MAG: YbjN domain-containing protein [Planctomycetes bacterium]|nr:YbjN domain-containing protein [Planctomycetota bacterium]